MNIHIRRFLKSIHNLFLKIGINISFAKTAAPNSFSAVRHNTLESMNSFYSDPQAVMDYVSPERITFYKNIINILLQHRVQLSGKSIVDVGCGTGHLLSFIKKDHEPISVTGLEYSVNAITIAKNVMPEADYYLYDIYSKPQSTHDIVLCTEVLEHLLHPDKAIQNLISMAKPNGVIFITVPNGRLDTYDGHINF
jgi:2-polyprenyl-3-methyl-5-hydroxy-6-metoxy-1,4-benzoquinol methylase